MSEEIANPPFELSEKAREIYEVFKDYFEDKNVDIQKVTSNCLIIIVYFPVVKITNEHDRCVVINDLWAKVKISNFYGTLIDKFTLNRSQYDLTQYLENYMHSHVSNIPKEDPTQFQNSCLGTGPIIETIDTLHREYNVDIWKLFCLELDKYVHTESISGVPYHRLEALGHSNGYNKFGNPCSLPVVNSWSRIPNIEKAFVRYLIEKKVLKFNYVGNSYSLGMNHFDLILLISNIFIEWYNTIYLKNIKNLEFEEAEDSIFDHLMDSKFLEEFIIYNKCIYSINPNTRVDRIEEVKANIGKQVLTFKGEPVYLNITGIDKSKTQNKAILINPYMISYWLCIILKVLNYRYGRDKTEYNKEIKYL